MLHKYTKFPQWQNLLPTYQPKLEVSLVVVVVKTVGVITLASTFIINSLHVVGRGQSCRGRAVHISVADCW